MSENVNEEIRGGNWKRLSQPTQPEEEEEEEEDEVEEEVEEQHPRPVTPFLQLNGNSESL